MGLHFDECLIESFWRCGECFSHHCHFFHLSSPLPSCCGNISGKHDSSGHQLHTPCLFAVRYTCGRNSAVHKHCSHWQLISSWQKMWYYKWNCVSADVIKIYYVHTTGAFWVFSWTRVHSRPYSWCNHVSGNVHYKNCGQLATLNTLQYGGYQVPFFSVGSAILFFVIPCSWLVKKISELAIFKWVHSYVSQLCVRRCDLWKEKYPIKSSLWTVQQSSLHISWFDW